MAFEDEKQVLIESNTVFGVDEKGVFEIFNRLKLEDIRCFRTSTPEPVTVDGVTRFIAIGEYDSEQMKRSFLHFNFSGTLETGKKALEKWTKYPYVTDAMLMWSAFEGTRVLPKPILAEMLRKLAVLYK